MEASVPPPRRLLAQLLVGNQIQQAIHVATRLGVPDLLETGPRSIDELARATGAHAGALLRLLRALAPLGIFAEQSDGRFASTPAAVLLCAGAPGSMRAFALWSGGVSYQVFGALEYSVRTGDPAFAHLFELDFFDYLERHPEVGAQFDELMAWSTMPLAPELVAWGFAGQETVVDVGGGRGDLLAALLKAFPSMRGVLVDGPRATRRASGYLQARGLGDRCATVCADIRECVPEGGDVYVLKSVLHGFDDAAAARVLEGCHRAMAPTSRLLLIEFIMPPGNEPFPGKLMDLLMLVGCRGHERTRPEFESLLAAAGFRMGNVLATKVGYSLIEAVPMSAPRDGLGERVHAADESPG